jgi:hypothetical protein
VIDLAAHLNTVVVDADKKLIKVGGGATWAPVDEEAAKHGLATVGGTVNHTGTLLSRVRNPFMLKFVIFSRRRRANRRWWLWMAEPEVRSCHR